MRKIKYNLYEQTDFPNVGWFHGVFWGKYDSYAHIEDSNGEILLIPTNGFRFLTPPDQDEWMEPNDSRVPFEEMLLVKMKDGTIDFAVLDDGGYHGQERKLSISDISKVKVIS